MLVYPGIFRIAVPMPGPLVSTNCYLIESEAGHLLIDAGWSSDTAWQTLWRGLEAAGVKVAPGCIDRLLITHVHIDHIGMAGRIKEAFGARVLMHSYEQALLEPRYVEPKLLLGQMTEWLKSNGVPESALAELRDVSLPLTGKLIAKPDQTLNGGETLFAGAYRWQVIWTPGHSSGHICLYEPEHQVLITGDHILPGQTPNISLHPQSTPNPLADYLDSLEQIRHLPVKLILPGHGEPFADLPGWLAHTAEHHQRRLDALRAALQQGRKSAWDAAAALRWTRNRCQIEELDEWNQRLALLETLSHLEYLRLSDGIRKDFRGGVARYFIKPPATPST